MNINQVRQTLGDAVPNEVKTLELRVGQVVRGVVLQQLPNQEAVISINGVQVKAKLEVPILEGQASLLQVQPDSKGGNIHFKQVDPTTLGLQDPMKDILKAMQLPDKQWAHELVKDLRREGFALNKEAALAFQRAASLMPPGVNQEQWMQAAATLFKRGLPLSEATLTAMHQVQHGTQAHTLIDQLRNQLLSLQQNQSTTQTQALVKQLISFLNNVSNITSQMANITQSSAQPNTVPHGLPSSASQPSVNVSNQSATLHNIQSLATSTSQAQPVAVQAQFTSPLKTDDSSLAGTVVNNQAVNTQGAQAAHSNANQPNLLSQLMKMLGVNHEAMLSKQVIGQQQMTTQTGVQQTINNGQQLAQQANANQQQSASTNITQSLAQTPNQVPQANQVTTNGPMIANTAQQAPDSTVLTQSVASSQTNSGTVGNQTSQPPNQATSQAGLNSLASVNSIASSEVSPSLTATNSASATTTQGLVNGQSIGQQLNSQAQQTIPTMSQTPLSIQSQESIKSSIIQLIQQQDVPASIKETAQQLLQAITGQQLMLSAERNQSVFSHVTMYIPLKSDEDGQTAAVHIQTRRDRKGELDAENCRIVFDLNMRSLGPVLVDMNIVNKIISLNLWNDHPALETIMEALKPEINDALYKNGYMLSSVRTTPIPEKEVQQSVVEGKAVVIPPDIDQLNSKRYKGVDFKV